ncbi:plasma membrane ascorbate-dependent reductase CYBRD1-like [Symsagittifera roscoffensis]|uniref:plasma membrane ascorbate-dependent reductase CYBRD1-like n=1 Tax=Symsagittifera roscoffensis TaxID=84072 RepID=UPI00307B2DE8
MTLKIIHTVIHLISAVCIIVALIAVVDQHNRAKLPNMYSLHSWAGIASIAMFFVQIIIGTVAFLTPIVPVYFKAYLMPIHRFVGTANFAMAVVAIISGITEKLIFMGAAEYGRLPSYAVMGNFLGITVILYSVGVAILVIYPDFKRVEKNK